MSEINYNYEKMYPFKWFILQNFPFIEDGIDTLTNYQLFSKLGEEINKNRDAINSIGQNEQNVVNAFNQLHDYIQNYFDNLDVQDEINEKLDEMANNGTLGNIIANYMTPIINQQNQAIATQNNIINGMQHDIDTFRNQFTGFVSGAPLVVTSTDDMTDTTRTYVNTSNGKWYYYDGDSWEIGGDYQSTGISTNSITPDMTKMWKRNSLLPKYGWKTGKVYNANTGDLQTYEGSYNEEYVDVHSYTLLLTTGFGDSTLNKLRVYFYKSDYTYLSYARMDNKLGTAVPNDAYYARFALWSTEWTEMPDNFAVYDLDTFNSTKTQYNMKDFYENTINRSDKIELYDPYFEILPYTSSTYGATATVLSLNKNQITIQYANTSASTAYAGFFIRGDLKAGDVIKIDAGDYAPRHVIYPYNGTSASVGMSKIGGYWVGTMTQAVIDANTSGIKAYMISNGILANTSTTVTYTVYVNDKPVKLTDFADDLKNSINQKPTLKVLALGDSITALTGERSWLTYFNAIQPISIIQNVAVSGACLMDYNDTVYDGNPIFNGPDNNHNNVLGNQVQKILNNNYSAPDIILIAIGTNNGINCTEQQIYDSYYDSSGNLIALSNVDRKTSAGAYRYCNDKLRTKYPNATIFWCSPIQGANSVRNLQNIINYSKNLEMLTKYSSSQFIDTEKCGITGYTETEGENGLYLIDGLHPNANGAKYMGYYNATKVKEYADSCKLLTT